MDSNLDLAKELRRALPANEAAGAEPLRLRVDSPSGLAKLLGERVAVNALQAGILVQVLNRPLARTGAASPEPPADAHLFVWHYSSLSSRAELDSMFAAYNLSEPVETMGASRDHQELYERERQILDQWRVLPLVTEAESAGLGPTVRDWMPGRWGEWRLAEVWLEPPEPAAADISSSTGAGGPSSSQPGAVVPGAKP